MELLATRRILDASRESRLRELLETVRRGAQPDEVIVREDNPQRTEAAQRFVEWLHEWRER